MNTILGDLAKSNKFVELIADIVSKKSPIAILGLTDFGMVQNLVAINEFAKKPICIVTYNEIQAEQIFNNIKCFTEDVYLFPKKEIVTYDYDAESYEIPYKRIAVLNKINESKRIIVVTTIEAIMQKIPPKEVLYKNELHFKVGKECNLEELKKKLVELGYTRNKLIDGSGQFSVRGDIIDVSLNEEKGIRIELWGEEVDSIRIFNVSSQRSTDSIQKVTIYPTHEYLLDVSIDDVCKKIRQIELLDDKQEAAISDDLEQIKNGNYISKMDKYFDLFYPNQSNFLEYINEKYVIVFDEKSKIEARAKNIKEDLKNLTNVLVEKKKFVPQVIQNMLTVTNIRKQLVKNKSQIIYTQKNDTSFTEEATKYRFNYREINYYKSEITPFIKDIKKYLEKNRKVYILLDAKEKVKKVQAILNQEEINNIYEESLNQRIITKKNQDFAIISVGKISEGFECIDSNQVVLSANNFVQGKKNKKIGNTQFKEAQKVVFADLQLGDYVVHNTCGIGIYVGVNTIKADGTIKDYIKIKYKDDDVLYVPTNQMDSVRKYIGGDGIIPKVSKLGSKEWEKTKEKVKNNLRAVAKELIELYARREKATGFAFSKDTPWQKQFEDTFLYEETEDQLRCIEEVKKDMESPKPMDRLLCGDVGYGKTEVAIRAAFKAVMDQKQVAYLVPTTVLAEQQYEEFKTRMEKFAVNVEILNRFKSAKYQQNVIRKLELGEVDVVIGTHRILSKDIKFKDLGLLIIDEEHRFGVKAKEKIKQYKTNVDVLTMTATPIPRTLHMSIVGIRDMSVIYDPPHNRKPVQTYVLEYDTEVIKEAITKEIERKGQVFYLFNNVEKIQRKANEIMTLVPEANVVYAHGQMTGTQVENIMKDYIDKKTNVLVCTTILESGIDIPNANTIIVENADRMGLAQLYQIRGRVGRSQRQAYAYITYKRDKLLSEIATKRLKAIKEFTEFGSGFKIAMRDLEIRGAGSLIGEIQSGHLEQVGYDTYCQILDQIIKEEKGEITMENKDVQIDLNVTSYIPEDYISDGNQKIEVYQNIALCKSEEDIQDLIDELIDRFGNMPEELEKLIEIARIKYMANLKNIRKIINRETRLIFYFLKNGAEMNVEKLLKEYETKIKFIANKEEMNPRVILEIGIMDEREILEETKKFLKLV